MIPLLKNTLFIVIITLAFPHTGFAGDVNTGGSPVVFNGLADALKALSEQVTEDLQAKSIKNLAVSKIYFNGLGTGPVAIYLQQKFLGEMLENAPDDFTILERGDIQFLIKENQLQWTVKGKTENLADESNGLLMGEFLYNKNFRQAFLSIRVIDSKSSKIISARFAIINIDPDLSKRLGISYNALPKANLYQPQPRIISNTRIINKLKKLNSLSLSPVYSASAKYQFPLRVFYGFAVADFVKSGINVLERELLYQIADEQTLANKTLDSLLMSDGIIRTIVDESSPENAPTFFTKAIRRKGGALLAQMEVQMKPVIVKSIKPKDKDRQVSNNNAAGYLASTVNYYNDDIVSDKSFDQSSSISPYNADDKISNIGSDDSLAAAIRTFKNSRAVTQSDVLRFTAFFSLSDKMSRPKKFTCWGGMIDLCSIQDNKFVIYRSFIENRKNVNRKNIFDSFLEKLIPVESDYDALKASMVSVSIVGVEDPNTGEYFLGPLNLIRSDISSKYTLNNDGKPNTYQGNSYRSAFKAFADSLYKSMNPKLRDEMENPINPYSGTFRWEYYGKEIIFNYSIETRWQGKYPKFTKLIMDFSPMRDKLYKVKQQQ